MFEILCGAGRTSCHCTTKRNQYQGTLNCFGCPQLHNLKDRKNISHTLNVYIFTRAVDYRLTHHLAMWFDLWCVVSYVFARLQQGFPT